MRPEARLAEGFSTLGLGLSAEQSARFISYLSELRRWGKAYNLIGPASDDEIVVKHFLDSALYLKALGPDDRLIADIGSGAGFPGVVLKILRPELDVKLIEPVQKKTIFMGNLIRALGLAGIEPLRARVEDVKGLSVDVAVTRALFSAREFYNIASHIVRPGGRFILSKGPKADEEIAEARGLQIEVIRLRLPVEQSERNLIVITKEG